MMVLITYDVNTTTRLGEKRLRQVAKECVNYGHRVQNSVFECVLTEAQFVFLRAQIENIIDKNTDNIRFYFLGKNWNRRIVSLGKDTSIDVTSELII
jgi:CRISPR-associated protein Cas2